MVVDGIGRMKSDCFAQVAQHGKKYGLEIPQISMAEDMERLTCRLKAASDGGPATPGFVRLWRNTRLKVVLLDTRISVCIFPPSSSTSKTPGQGKSRLLSRTSGCFFFFFGKSDFLTLVFNCFFFRLSSYAYFLTIQITQMAFLKQTQQMASCLGRKLGREHASTRRLNRQVRTIVNLSSPHQAAAISRIQTNIDPSSDEYKENQTQMTDVMSRMQKLSAKIQLGGSEKARAKHLARKKMLPRDRVTALIDPGTTFLELSPMAGYELYPEAEVPAGGIITGVGVVEGVTCVIVANDSTVKGGTYYPITVKKHLRAQAVAQENKLP